MKRFFFWLLFAPIAIICAVFAVENREAVKLSLWPTPFSIDIPLFLMVLGALAIGLVIGGLFVWLGSAKLRVRLRDRDVELRSLKRDLDSARAENQKLTDAQQQNTIKALPPAA